MSYYEDAMARENLKLKKMTILLEVSNQLYELNEISKTEHVSNLRNIYNAL